LTKEETVAADQATHALHAQFEAILTGKEATEADQATHVLHAQTDTRRNSQSSSGTCFNSYQWCSRSSSHDQCLLCLSLVACGEGLVLLYVLLQCSAVQEPHYDVLPDLTRAPSTVQHAVSFEHLRDVVMHINSHGVVPEQHSSTLQQYA